MDQAMVLIARIASSPAIVTSSSRTVSRCRRRARSSNELGANTANDYLLLADRVKCMERMREDAFFNLVSFVNQWATAEDLMFPEDGGAGVYTTQMDLLATTLSEYDGHIDGINRTLNEGASFDSYVLITAIDATIGRLRFVTSWLQAAKWHHRVATLRVGRSYQPGANLVTETYPGREQLIPQAGVIHLAEDDDEV